MFPRINGNARGAPEGQINPAQGRATPRAERHPGDAMHDPSPASCKPPPDLLRAGRGVVCRMRDFFHTIQTQGLALGYRPATFQAAGTPADGLQWTFPTIVGAKNFSPLQKSNAGTPAATHQRPIIINN